MLTVSATAVITDMKMKSYPEYGEGTGGSAELRTAYRQFSLVKFYRDVLPSIIISTYTENADGASWLW